MEYNISNNKGEKLMQLGVHLSKSTTITNLLPKLHSFLETSLLINPNKYDFLLLPILLHKPIRKLAIQAYGHNI